MSITMVLALCSLGSFLSALYITISCLVMWMRRKKPTFKGAPAYFLTHHAFYIALCDLAWHAPYFSCNFYVIVKPDWEPTQFLCTIIAVSYQFSGIWMNLWYTALSISVWYMIKDTTYLFRGITDLQHTLPTQTAITITLAIISTVIPWHDYGRLRGFEYGGRDCWVMDTSYQLILYGWVVLSMTSDLVLAFYAFRSIHVYKLSEAVVTDRITLQVKFIHRLYYFVLVDIFVWILPLIYRGFMLVDGKSPIWIKDGHNVLLVCLGMVNALIWSTTKEFESVFRYCQCCRISQLTSCLSGSEEGKETQNDMTIDNSFLESNNVVKSKGRVESLPRCIENSIDVSGEYVRLSGEPFIETRRRAQSF